jgi:uncharacterized protein YukE
MSTIKERIAQDLSQVKETGGARTKRIREIVQVAVTEAVNEIKDGSGEIRNIASYAVTAVIENFKTKGQQAKDEAMAAMEGVIAGVKDSHTKQQASQPIGEQQIFEAIDGALVAVESTQQKVPRNRIVALLLAAFNALRSKLSVNFQKDYVSLKELLANWDGKLAEKYGDRYSQIKQRWEAAQSSYNATKTKIANGEPSPVDEYQTEADKKAAKAGATVAQTEHVIRKQLKTILESAAAKL